MLTDRSLGWCLMLAVAVAAPGWDAVVTLDLRAAAAEVAADTPETSREAYFGDLHIHTMYSYDAFLASERNSPDDAYRYAKGEPIRHRAGGTVQLSGPPLDFLAITDHAEWLGVHTALESSKCDDKGSSECRAAMGAAWQRGIAAAERHNDPGTFTALIGYEYGASHPVAIHRNVVFRSATVPALPFSRWDSDNPGDLWDWLDRQRGLGMDAVAIPHNSNQSGGWEFRPRTWEDAPLDAAYARQRMRNEPLVEVTQNKGTAEVHPLLAPNDEWAGFQIKDGQVRHSTLRGKYWRAALKTGLEVEGELDVNPFRLGVVGGSDSHVTGGSYDEDAYFTNRSTVAEQRREVFIPTEDGWVGSLIDPRGKAFSGTGGLTGIWAEENTRASLFDALRRRETFATSGPRIKVRFFAGYGLAERLAEPENEVVAAYANGVPMGGVLGARSDVAPSFLVWAVRDPQAGRLQRLQIVKGWLEGGSARERVIDVACSDGLAPDSETGRCPDNGATVDVADCSVSADVGANELRTVWTDPDFDVSQPAFYYVRVLENPSCRWSTWDAVRLGTEPHPGLPATHQERAWSSPIWFDASRIELVLAALSLSDVDIGVFAEHTTEYAGSAAYGLESTTVTARAASSGATVTIMPPDADAEMEGHQVALSEGENKIEVSVTTADGTMAVDGVTTRTYTVRVNRASPPDYDALVAAGNGAPRGFWGDGEKLWVADYLDSKLYAYAMADGRHVAARDVETLAEAGNSRPTGVWSNGETLWVADYWDAKLYGYRLADGRRAAVRDVTLAAGNRTPTGLWGDGQTLWVLDKGGARVYAYRVADGSRDEAREFALTGWEAGESAWGLWSDGEVFLVGGYTARRVFAYRDGSRAAGRDLAPLRNQRPTGLWSDGRNVWVSEYQGGHPKLYAHPLSAVSTNATLTQLGLSDVDLGPFSPTKTAYRGETGAARVTVSAFPAEGASLVIEPPDADTAAPGHQVDLPRAETLVTVAVTAADGAATRTYRVTVGRPATLPVVTLAADGSSVPEGSAAGFTALLDTVAGQALEVAVGVTAEGAVLSGPVPSSVAFTVGATRAALAIPTADDTMSEPDGSVTATLLAGAGYLLGDAVTATVAVRDEDPPPSVAVAYAEAWEGSVLSFTVTLSEASGLEATVDYATSDGTATSGSDYAAASGTLTFAAGETAKTVDVTTMDDDADEADETLTLRLSDPTGATLGTATATGMIGDDDAPSSVDVGDVEAPEGAVLSFAVTLSRVSGREVAVAYATSDGTATSGSDYVAASGTLTFAAGETAKTVDVATMDDAADEADETLTLSLSNAVGATLDAAAATGTIVDDDVAPTVTATFDPDTVPAEHDGSEFRLQFVFSEEIEDIEYAWVREALASATGGAVTNAGRVAPPSNAAWVLVVRPTSRETATTVTLAAGAALPDGRTLTAGDTVTVAGRRAISVADAAADEGDTASFAVTLDWAAPAAVTVAYATSDGTAASGSDYAAATGTLTFAAGEVAKSVDVALIDDAADENDETFTVTLGDVTGDARVADGTATGTIGDDDDPPAVDVADAAVPEGSVLSFAVTLSAASGREVTVDYATSDDTATSGSDYAVAAGTLRFAAGETEKTVAVATVDDGADEADETLTLSLSNAVGATLGVAAATGTIADDDAPPAVDVGDVEAPEGTALSFAVTLSAASGGVVAVDYATEDGTATSGSDYAAATGTLTFAPGETSKSVDVWTTDDDTGEDDETLALRLSDAVGATLGTAAATGTIVDDDALGVTATFDADTVPAAHDGSEFRLQFAFSEELEGVGYAWVRDMAAATGGAVTNAGRVAPPSNAAWVLVVRPESPDTATTVTLAAGTDLPDGRTLLAGDTVTVAGRRAVSVADAAADEGSTASFSVTLGRAAPAAVIVDYATADGTATSGSDYVAASGTLTFAAGETSKSVGVSLTADALDEDDETFTLTLGDVTGDARVADGTATGTIGDDDPPPVVGVADASAPEGTALTFAVALSAASGREVTVDYATADGTASASVDYAAASGTLTFVAGETSKSVVVATVADDLEEDDETLTLRLSDAVGAALGAAAATGTIADAAPGVTATFDPDTVPRAHGGSAFRLQFVFSEEIEDIEYAWVRDVLATATGGAVTNAGRVAPPSNVAWALVVEPASSDTATTVTLAAGAALPDGRTLRAGDAVTVPGQRGVSAAFDADTLPAEHDGSTAFAVALAFSEDVAGIGYAWVRDTLVSAGNGTVLSARRTDPPTNRGWELEVEPADAADVTLTVVDGLELPDGRTLAGGDVVTVRGPQPQETTVDGPLVMLTWSDPRDGFGAPSGSDYAVRVNGAAREVSSASLESRTVRLWLSAPVLPEDAVTVGYVGSAMHPLADAGGRLRSAPWDGLPAVNVTGSARTAGVRAVVAVARPADPVGATHDDAVVLEVGGLGLSDVAGLARLTALERLDLSGNAVTDLGALAGLRALRDLDLSGNRVSDLWPLAGLSSLERLDLSDNRIADAGPLAGLPRLTVLVLDGNVVSDLWPLAQLGALEHLGLSGNRVTDVTALQDLAGLRRLDLGGNPVRELSPLGDVRTLVWLTLPAERLEAHGAALGRLTRLRWVWSSTPYPRSDTRRSGE